MGKMRRCVPGKNTTLVDKTTFFLLPFLFTSLLTFTKYSSTLHSPPVRNSSHLDLLTPEQTEMLQETLDPPLRYFDGKTPFDQTVPSSFKGQVRDEEGTTLKAGWFGRRSASEVSSRRFFGEVLKMCFWKLAMMDHPDILILKVYDSYFQQAPLS